eukprot:g3280.t1
MNGTLYTFVRSSNGLDDNGVMTTLLLAMRNQMIVKAQKETEKKDVTRVLVAAFFEIADELSDIVMAILFSLNADDLGWAATLMFVFMGINRIIVANVAYNFNLPYYEVLEGLLGLKSITDSYRLVRYGNEIISGSVSITIMRGYTLASGLACESLPQMILQISIVLSELDNEGFNQGIFVAQLLSVLASCVSIGISFATISVDFSSSKREIHPSGGKWLPKDDSFRETLLFVCLIITNALHLLLAAFGFSSLFVFADVSVSLSILFSSLLIFNTMRYVVNDTGWRGIGLYNVKSDVGTLSTIPILGIIYFVIVNVSNLLVVRYQGAIGPLPFTYGVVSSMAIAMTSIFLLVNDSLIKLIFGILFVVYVVVWLIFISVMDETLISFLFSTAGWKKTIRDELWNIPIHASTDWGIEELVGDDDANYAMQIQNYKSSDLPWDKIEKWLIEKKSVFLESPPLWMTVAWFKNLTPEVKKGVWTEPGELELLIEKVTEVTKIVNDNIDNNEIS